MKQAPLQGRPCAEQTFHNASLLMPIIHRCFPKQKAPTFAGITAYNKTPDVETMRTLLSFLLCFFLLACNNNAQNNQPREPAPDAVYYDYQVWGAEGDSAINVTFQYRGYGGDGPAQKLNDSTSVLLDGQPMTSDSSAYNGTVYETMQPATTFVGQHIVSFIDNNGEVHKESFQFKPFTLAEELPERLKKEPFTIRLKNFPAEQTPIRLILTDTSFNSRDVNDEMTIENGLINVNASQLANLVPGPVTLEIYREDERPLKQTGKEGGRILMMYSLRRELELVQ